MGVNTKYKDSVFSFLFSNPDALRELYSALEGITLPPDLPIEINTLTDVLYMGRINDVSFTVDNRLVVLIEHQSTINPNMPLRLLMYIVQVYEKLIDRKNIYRSKMEKIPCPEFIVLYNGHISFPDHVVLKLSDAFKEAVDLKHTSNSQPALELIVPVYNINKGHNQEMIQKSRTLAGYSSFVDLIRENGKTQPHGEALRSAITYCIEHNILKHFLENHRSEVISMLDWNLEEAKEVWQEDAREEGREEGMEKGREEGREDVARNAIAKGLPVELIHDITGLEIELIESFASS